MIVGQRLRGVDFLRALACLAVVGHHLIFRLDGNDAPAWARPWLEAFSSGSFGVAIFFCLSGFLLARPFWLALDEGKPMPSLVTYGLRRAARILPGFWLALTATFLLSFTVLDAPFGPQLVTRYLAGFLLVSDWHWVSLFPVEFNGPLWSIGFEITSYALMPLGFLLLFAVRPERWASRVMWLGVIAAALVLHGLIVAYAPVVVAGRGWRFGLVGGAKMWMPRYNPLGFFAIFALGSLAAGVQVFWRQRRGWRFDALALLGLGVALVMAATNGRDVTEGYGLFGVPYGFPWFPVAIGLVLAAAPSSVVFGRIVDNRVSRFIAKISFGIYLWHFLIIELMIVLAPPSFAGSGADAWSVWLVSSAVLIGLSVVAGTLSYYLVERPVVAWARTLEKPRPGVVPVPA